MSTNIQQFTETKDRFVALWESSIPTFMPSEAQWITWLSLHDEHALLQAVIKTVARYVKSQGAMDGDYLIKYCSAVANSIPSKL